MTPLAASRKTYIATCSGGARVPFRKISLSDPEAPVFRVYDTSGPCTDPEATIDLRRGVPHPRPGTIARRADTEAYQGRAARPEDNGNARCCIEKLTA